MVRRYVDRYKKTWVVLMAANCQYFDQNGHRDVIPWMATFE